MVVSNLNPDIKYRKINKSAKYDRNHNALTVSTDIYDNTVILLIGKKNNKYKNKNVIFHYVYMVINENEQQPIGIYEYNVADENDVLDMDNDINISVIPGPLLFINKKTFNKYVDKMTLVNDIEDNNDGDGINSDEDSIDNTKNINFIENDNVKDNDKKFRNNIDMSKLIDDNNNIPFNENETQDNNIKSQYVDFNDGGDAYWLRRYTRNNNYDIIDVAGDGNCFFYTIRDAFKSIGNHNFNSDFLRTLLSDIANENDFINYRELYDNYVKSINNDKKSILKYNKIIKQYKQNNTIGNDNIKDDMDKIQLIIKKIKDLKNDIQNTNILLGDVSYLKNINTLNKFKKFIKTKDYWADQWAIENLEIMLNTKIIILSSENYIRNNLNNILQCNDANNIIKKKNIFNPKYYIIVEHTGNHYKLVTYKDKKIFRFHELPYSIIKIIMNRCMKGDNIYKFIPKFKRLLNINDINNDDSDDINIKDKGIMLEDDENELETTPTPKKEDELKIYDDDIVFKFYSKSASYRPGMGSGEKIPKDKIKEYDELMDIDKDWRKVLSNFYMKPSVVDNKGNTIIEPLFNLDGLNWASVEHYYHANKFKNNNIDFYKQFSLDSNSEISKNPRLAKSAGSKSGKYGKIILRPKHIKLDKTFFDNKNNEDVMENGQLAKYTQNEKAKRILLATKNAKLLHIVPRSKPIIFYDTMRIRNKLKNT